MMVGSATKAALSLGVSQPAISRALGELEREAGFVLFERRGGRLTATPDGALFHEKIERHLAALGDIDRIAGSIRALRAGSLRITAMQVFANGVAPMALSAFLAKHPDIAVSLDGRARSYVIESVAAGDADIGVGSLPVDDAGVETVTMATLPAVVALPAGHRLAGKRQVTAADLASEPFITFPPTSQFRLTLDAAFASAGLVRRTMIEVHSTEAACALVRAGTGVAVLVPFLPHLTDDPALRLIRFEPLMPVTLAALLPARRATSLPARAFLEELGRTVARLWPRQLDHRAAS